MKALYLILLFCLGSNLSAQELFEKGNNIERPYDSLDKVPVYPGCDEFSTQNEIKECMIKKINTNISENFNKGILENSGLKDGKYRIIVSFKIDKKGEIIDIHSKGANKKGEKEANRVIRSLPTMVKPGFHKNTPAVVPYSLPILFEIAKSNKSNGN